jgi:hypothetical protein
MVFFSVQGDVVPADFTACGRRQSWLPSFLLYLEHHGISPCTAARAQLDPVLQFVTHFGQGLFPRWSRDFHLAHR